MTTGSLRIALASNLAPRKIGSMEETFVEFAKRAHARGHDVTLFVRTPVHPWMERELAACGARWRSIADVEASFVAGSVRLRRDFDALLFTLLPLRGRLAMQAALAWPLRMVYLDENSQSLDAPHPDVLRRLSYRVMQARLSALACCSEYVRRRDRDIMGLDVRRARVIHNGVNVDRFVMPSERAPGPPRVLTVSNLIRDKGIDVLLDAFARLPHPGVRLSIVGDGRARQALEAQAAALGIASRVTFHGMRDDVEAFLRTADVFVHPARWHEAFGYTIAEAMACGCAIVSTDGGALPELITHGESGILVPSEQPQAMAEAIACVLDDPALAGRLGAGARAKAERSFALGTQVDALVALVEEAARR